MPRHSRGQLPPRTVLVAHPGADVYGSDRMLVTAVSGLVDAGLRVIVALPDDGPLVPMLETAGADVRRCPTPVLRKSALSARGLVGLAARTLSALPAMVRLVRSEGVDVVYVNTVTIPAWLFVARALGRRVLAHVHEAEANAGLLHRALSLPLLAAHTIVANSRYTRDTHTAAVPAVGGRVIVVTNGVAQPETVRPTREHLDPPVRLLYVGRLSPRKGVDVAVAALRRLREQGMDARLRLVGNVFPGYEWFEAQLRADGADLLACGALEFAGYQANVSAALADCDIALVPSVEPEGFGNTAVEAVLAGRPVVVSDIGGLPEAVAGVGSARIVPPGDAVELARAIALTVVEWERARQAAAHAVGEVGERQSVRRYQLGVVSAVLGGPSGGDEVLGGNAVAGAAGEGRMVG